MRHSNITKHFQNYFYVVYANTPELQRKAFRIRYDVYCKEFGYERAENYTNEMEYDEYDAKALHCLIIHRQSNFGAGCVRVIPGDANDASDVLPFERYCGHSLNSKVLEELRVDRAISCEASRLAVHTLFRRRLGESISQYGAVAPMNFTIQEQRTFPTITVALALATQALAESYHRNMIYAMMEPFLPRLLKRIGFYFRRVGAIVDYHGKRAAYVTTTQSVIENLPPEIRELYEFIADAIKSTAEIGYSPRSNQENR